MENYSRMMIHFVHNLMQKHKKVHAFLFGTKLTNISFQIKNKDIADALELPPIKIHCSVLAEDSIKQAIEDFEQKQ